METQQVSRLEPTPIHGVLPDLVRDQIGATVLRLAHQSTVVQGGFMESPTYEIMSTDGQSQEQAEANSKVSELMGHVGQYLAKAHESTVKIESISCDDQYGQNPEFDIYGVAKAAARDDALRAHEQGDDIKATLAIESMFAISMLGKTDDSNGEIRQLVSAGMAEQVVDAAQDMHGVIALPDGFGDVRSALAQYYGEVDLLQVATKCTFDDQIQHKQPLDGLAEIDRSDALGRLEKKLSPQDHVTLAALEANVRHDPDEALRNTVAAGEKILSGVYGYGQILPTDVAQIITIGAECASKTHDEGMQTRYHNMTDKMRARRSAGQKPGYRQNDPLFMAFDGALVHMAAEGNRKGVMALVSSSSKEADNIGWPIKFLNFSEQAATVSRKLVEECSADKRALLQETLAKNGAPDWVFKTSVDTVHDPDGMGRISEDFWTAYKTGEYEDIQRLLFGEDAHNQSRRAEDVLGLINAGIAIDKISYIMIPRMSKLSPDERLQYLRQVAGLVQDIIANDNQGEAGFSKEILTGVLEYQRPSDLLSITQWLYGDTSLDNVLQVGRKLAGDKKFGVNLVQLDETKLERFKILKQVEIDILAGYDEILRSQMLLYALGEEDPIEALRSVKNMYESTAFLREAEREYVDKDGKVQVCKLDIPFMAHPKEWIAFIESLPRGEEGSRARALTLDRLFLPHKMANLKENAFTFQEDPVEAIRIFTEIAPTSEQMIGKKLNPIQLEVIRLLINANDSIAVRNSDNRITGFRGFPSTNPNKLKGIFYNNELAGIYTEIFDAKKAGLKNLEALLYRYPELRQQPAMGSEQLPKLIAKMRISTDYYRKEPVAYRAWMKQFATEPIKAHKLLSAWKSRAMALTYRDANDPNLRVEDNPKSILDFVATHGVKLLAHNKREEGALTITEAEEKGFKEWIDVIGSAYDSDKILRALEKVAEHRRAAGPYPRKIISADSMSVSVDERVIQKDNSGVPQEFVTSKMLYASVLDGTDARAFTIGVETGCCMTLGGASESCIWAGLEDPRYSFFTVREQNGKLRAQSILYLTEDMGKKYLVVDNIEANQGTDLSKIIIVYKEALVEFVNRQRLNVDAIHVGQGNMEESILDGLPDAIVRPATPRSGTYSDAEFQKVLWVREP